MAIVQISKIQQRAGNLVDLPQLDNAEFGWATDENRLFIGRTGNTYTDQNIEVLTSYSNISFSQISGSDGGNFNITTPLNGQLLTYVSSTDTWENYTGLNAQLGGTKLQLGNVSNLSMTGGAIGYILQTDGSGNLSWTPKNTLYTPVVSLSTATPIIMTVANTTPYTNGQTITITGVNGVANANVNGLTFYLTLLANYASSGQVALYTDIARTTGANGTSLTYTNSPNAIATASLGGSGSGTVGGSNTTVQFNDQNVLTGNASFTYNKLTNTLTISTGNVDTGNLNATTTVTASRLVSNVATGTAPFTVTSTTQVANLNSATAGTVRTAAQPNITSVGTLTSLVVTGNITGGNLLGVHANGNSNVNIPAANGNVNISAVGVANVLVVTATGANVTGTANVSGNANVLNLGTTQVLASANVTAPQLISNVATGTAPLIVTSTTQVANLNVATAGAVQTNASACTTVYLTGTTSSSNGYSALNVDTNITANLANHAISAWTVVGNLVGSVTTAAQGNITSLGTLTSLVVTGNTTSGNLLGVHANGNSNVNIPSANGNVNISAVGVANILVVTGTGANITGTANVSGNANVGNLGTAQVFASANITAPQLISNVATGTAPLIVTSTTQIANMNVATAGSATSATNAAAVQTNTSTTSTVYLAGVTSSSNGNSALNIVSGISANMANNAISATTFVGNLSGTVTTAAQGQITSLGTLTSLGVTGNTTSGNFVGRLANGNSNVNIPAIYGNVTVSVTGISNVVVITNTGMNVAGTANVSGNANVGNLGTDTLIATTGNITTINSGLMKNSTSNITIASAGNVSTFIGGNATAQLVVTETGANIPGTANIVGNANVGNLNSAGSVYANDNLIIGSTGVEGGQISIGWVGVSNTIGQANSTWNVDVDSVNNFRIFSINATGVASSLTMSADPATNNVLFGNSVLVSGNITTTQFISNVTDGTAPFLVSSSTRVPNLQAATSGTVRTAAQPNITSVSTSFTSLTFANAQTITGNNITLTTGANTNIGTITGNWSLSAGSKLQATYADLAEYYEADKPYEPGTVLAFGGDKEVTIADDGTTAVAGVVSTNPAYVMNSACVGEHIVALALQGRVPVKVRGTIHKGDMLVSGGEGYARPMIHPYIGSVIGKALENFEGEGVIEVAVGRL